MPLGMNTGTIDRFVPYFDIAIGLCLLLGLFTPLAALAAAGFLGSVFLSQFPPGDWARFQQLSIDRMHGLLGARGHRRWAIRRPGLFLAHDHPQELWIQPEED